MVVSDSFSDDGTVERARAGGAYVVQRPFDNFAGQRNAALETVNADWVFFVDADERITPELAAEVRQVICEQPKSGWWVPRHNYIAGQRVRYGGFYPDYQLRLLRRDRARYDPARPVHEVVLLDGPDGNLQNVMIHYNYDSWAQFRAKQRRYASLRGRHSARARRQALAAQVRPSAAARVLAPLCDPAGLQRRLAGAEASRLARALLWLHAALVSLATGLNAWSSAAARSCPRVLVSVARCRLWRAGSSASRLRMAGSPASSILSSRSAVRT